MSVLTSTPEEQVAGEEPVPGRHRVRLVIRRVLTVLAFVLLFGALVVPNQLGAFSVWAFLRLPVEALVGIGLALVLPRRPRLIVAGVLGALLGVVLVVKLADIGFYKALDRPFNLVFDWAFLPPAFDLVKQSAGEAGVVAAEIGAALLVVVLLGLMALACIRASTLVSRHRRTATRAGVALALVWVLCLVLGLQFQQGAPLAARSAASTLYHETKQVNADLKDRSAFASEVANDPFRGTPANQLLAGLQGKDVILTFVESYGRVAVQDSDIAPGIDALLDANTAQLKAAGFDARSAFLTSSTYGGGSWLAHSTLQSGTWVNNQQRYSDLVHGDRLTLTNAFEQAGWNTVSDIPSNFDDWVPETQFYGYKQIYDARNVGYKGPAFSYAAIPDQYTFQAFQDNVLGKPHAPLFAEIDTVSSHWPWAPLPKMVGWDQMGDGSIYYPMTSQGRQLTDTWATPANTRAGYGESIQYALTSMFQFLQRYGNDNTVLVYLGDHQPDSAVTGSDAASRDVPITIVAKDPKVFDRISDWGWDQGLHPNPQAPVWPMSAFRDKFFTAFGNR